MKSRKIQLKVKVKSLSEEARIIRKEERKFKKIDPQLFNELSEHRRGLLRYEARCSQLAYAYLRGREYNKVERKCKFPPDWKRVYALVEKFGRAWDGEERFSQFKQDRTQELTKFEKWKNAALSVVSS